MSKTFRRILKFLYLSFWILDILNRLSVVFFFFLSIRGLLIVLMFIYTFKLEI